MAIGWCEHGRFALSTRSNKNNYSFSYLVSSIARMHTDRKVFEVLYICYYKHMLFYEGGLKTLTHSCGGGVDLVDKKEQDRFAVPPEWDLVPKEAEAGGLQPANLPTGESVEHIDIDIEFARSQEKLGDNLERLNNNLGVLDTLSSEVIASPEGKEATETFIGNISARLKRFGSGIKEKVMSGIATLDNGERVAKVLGTVVGVGILAPAMMQFVRTRWPEAGVAMDMMPDALQQLAHLDLASRISDLIGGSGILRSF